MTNSKTTNENDLVYYGRVGTPIGTVLLVGNEHALHGLYFEGHDSSPVRATSWIPDDGRLSDARRQVEEYFAGARTEFDVPLRPRGTPFQLAVWNALLCVGYGETASYGDIARRIGRPTAVRAVGAANGRNPISIIIPCHRIIGSSGELVGYGWGLGKKGWLLMHEREHAPSSLNAKVGV